MATGFFHHIGTFLLFCAAIFLLITTISAPVINNIGLLTVNLPQSLGKGTEISFGTFGYCVQDATADDRDACVGSQVGYDPAFFLSAVYGVDFSTSARDTTRGLTKVMILHPIATFLNFLAFGMALSAGVLGSFVASMIALVSFLVTLVALVCDFVLFGIIKSNVNSNTNGNQIGGNSNAYFSVATWTLLVGAICSLLGTIVVFLTCCSSRIKSRRERPKTDGYTSPPRRRRWFRR